MFDWQTGDNGEWVEHEQAPPQAPTTLLTRKVKGGVALSLLLLLATLAFIYRRASSQATAVTTTVEQNVLAADQLLLETAVAGDEELFRSLLAHRASEWYDVQTRLLTSYLYLDRAPLGLWLDTEASLFATEFLSATQVTLSPDLTMAEVNQPLPFVTLDAKGLLQTLTLQRTAVYQRVTNDRLPDRWLLAEPDDTFWGAYQHVERPYLDLITPARDADIAERLAADLSTLLVTVCEEMATPTAVACPHHFTLQVRLDRDPASLLSLYAPVRLSTVYLGGQQTTRLSLPAPTLVGQPQNDAGYLALYRGYATHMVQAVLNVYAVDRPGIVPSGTAAFSPDLEQAMHDLGLFRPWPPEYSPIRVAEPPPIPFPAQDLLLLCQSSRAPILIRYDMDEGGWYDAPLDTPGAVNYGMMPLPDGEGVLLTVYATIVNEFTIYLVWLNNGRERVLLPPEAFPIFPSIMHVGKLADGRYFIYYTFTVGAEGEDAVLKHHAAILDESTCTPDACELQPFGRQLWPSPDGRYTLITRVDEDRGFYYALGDADGEVQMEIGTVRNPTWLDDRTLAFLNVRPTNSPIRPEEAELVMAVMPEDADGREVRQTRLTSESLEAVLSASTAAQPGQIMLSSFQINEQAPGQLIVSAFTSRNDLKTYLFAYDWQQDTLSLWPYLSPESGSFFRSLSPNGRYLTFVALMGSSTLRLFDLETEKQHTYAVASSRFLWNSFSWSGDGNWLLLYDDYAVRLIAPAYEYETKLFHGLGYCETAAWVNWQ